MEPEFIEWGGRRWKRDPKSKRRQHREYYVHSRWRSKKYLHRAIWESVHGPVPVGHHIHHLDENTFNNDITNLACISASEHARLHTGSPERRAFASQNGKRVLASPDVRARIAKWRASPAGKKWHKQHSKDVWRGAIYREFECEVCGKVFKSRDPKGARRCGPNCTAEARRRSGLDDVTARCPECGATFVKNKYAAKVNCSRVCGKRAADRTRGRRVQSDRRR